jgi:hypothetical protein
MTGTLYQPAGGPAWIVDGLILSVAAAVLLLLFSRRMRGSEFWRATATPLASIIGSGFLVVAPLLAFTVGNWALLAMAGLTALAYLVGGALRYNIAVVEGIVDNDHPADRDGIVLLWMERASKIALAFAYVIAIAFYLDLLGAFAAHYAGIHDEIWPRAIATALLLFIGGVGTWRGLRSLEGFESVAVNSKLAVIAALLIALAYHDTVLAAAGTWRPAAPVPEWSFDTIRTLCGAFLIIQGFETSRYLARVYDPDTRIRSMRLAQNITTAIYLAFIGLATMLFGLFDSLSETGIVDISARVATVLPPLLVIGALVSQFGAATADTLGVGGIVEEASGGRIGRRTTYGAVAALGIALIWAADIFAVIAYASRAFAVFYAVQCAMAAFHAWRLGRGEREPWRAAGFAALTLAMIAVAVLGIPAESAEAWDSARSCPRGTAAPGQGPSSRGCRSQGSCSGSPGPTHP